MKKLLLIFISALMFCMASIKAQITLEYSNDTLAFGENGFYCIDLGENESKYVIVNRNANSFSLYNIDMSPFITNIFVPATDSFKNGFTIGYITRTLFDCDSTNIEYVYQSPYQGQKPFRILRIDGTVLLDVDSARGPYCFGCWGGADNLSPIRQTSEGTKLFLDILNPSGFGIQIYALCGELPTHYIDFPQKESYITLFPNPADMMINFEIVLPNNQEEFALVIYQSNGNEMTRSVVKASSDKYALNVSNYSNGAYFYSLVSDRKAYQTGKFIISK